jgi:hypothetical protein
MLSLLLCGCATPALWKATGPRDWYPQFPPDQILVTTLTGRQDVVVVYSQSTGQPDKAKERWVAWTVGASPQDLAVGIKTIREFTNACDKVQILPAFYKDDLPSDDISAPLGFAVLDPDSADFTICLEQATPGPFILPNSREPCRAARRWAIMPFAVAADAVIVGTIAAGLAAAGMGTVGMNSF